MKLKENGTYIFKKGRDVFEVTIDDLFMDADGVQYMNGGPEYGWIEITNDLILLGEMVRTFIPNASKNKKVLAPGFAESDDGFISVKVDYKGE